MEEPSESPNQRPAALRRLLGLPLLVLYGTGITIGAGIYVLIGVVARHAGAHSAWAFALAATVMALTAASYAEMAEEVFGETAARRSPFFAESKASSGAVSATVRTPQRSAGYLS